jgi:hypothetical protein
MGRLRANVFQVVRFRGNVFESDVAALKQADGLAVAPPHRRRGISCRRVSSQVRAGYVTGGSIAVLTRQRTSEKDFECLASTGVTRKEKYFEGWAAAFG